MYVTPKMKLKAKVIAMAVASIAVVGFGANVSAQISGDVVKIGFITDISGSYFDIDGQGGVEATKMVIAGFSGNVNDKKIELVTADH
jgi:branched-chain amino acid transport system substrate-binding protein